MTSLRQAETIALKQCRNCSGELFAPDNFCRWCGVHQSDDPVKAADNGSRCEHQTNFLRADGEMHQSLSSLSLNTVAHNVATKTGSLRLNRFGVIVVAALIAIPMWLLIILLSPFDAYTSAKAASSRMNIQ